MSVLNVLFIIAGILFISSILCLILDKLLSKRKEGFPESRGR